MKKFIVSAVVGIGLLASVIIVSPSTSAAPNSSESKPIVVHLSKFTNDLHAVSMALKLATGMQAKGGSVTLFVDLDGVRLVDKRQPGDLSWGHGKAVGELYDNFVGAGGRTLVCPHCAHAAGLTKENLRPKAEIAVEGQIIDVLLQADKILDY